MGKGRRGNEWCDEEIRKLIQKKRKTCGRLLQNESEDIKEEYRIYDYPVKREVKSHQRSK